MRSWWWSPHDGTSSALIRGESLLSLCSLPYEDTTRPERGPSPEPDCAGTLISDFPAFRTIRNKFLLVINYPVNGIFLLQHKLIKTNSFFQRYILEYLQRNSYEFWNLFLQLLGVEGDWMWVGVIDKTKLAGVNKFWNWVMRPDSTSLWFQSPHTVLSGGTPKHHKFQCRFPWVLSKWSKVVIFENHLLRCILPVFWIFMNPL